ncbi:MAG: phage tail protein [Lactococcus garvieae]
MIEFLDSDEPNFIFKGVNALVDMGCIIETELPDIQAQPRIEEISIWGRSGTLTEWHGDYEPYDLAIGKISIPYENLKEVKLWLRGHGKLISHNDYDKYIEATPSFSSPLKFENEWGCFYTFELTFRCQPLKKRVNEQPILLNKSELSFYNHGDVKSFPKVEFYNPNNIHFKIICNDVELSLPSLTKGQVIIDFERGMAIQNNKIVPSIGEWGEIIPGENKISVYGDYVEGKLFTRSLYTRLTK